MGRAGVLDGACEYLGPLELMRLWSLHPRYLDARGLVALWREGLLAQAVLAGQTRGYKQHPQLTRFLASSHPERHIAAYLRSVQAEATLRGYRFDPSRIRHCRGGVQTLTVTQGQLHYEWACLTGKLEARAPAWLERFESVELPEPHPSFSVIAGGIADWEVGADQATLAAYHESSR